MQYRVLKKFNFFSAVEGHMDHKPDQSSNIDLDDSGIVLSESINESFSLLLNQQGNINA